MALVSQVFRLSIPSLWALSLIGARLVFGGGLVNGPGLTAGELEIYTIPARSIEDSKGVVVEWFGEEGVVYQLETADPERDLEWQPLPRVWVGKGRRVIHSLALDQTAQLLRLNYSDDGSPVAAGGPERSARVGQQAEGRERRRLQPGSEGNSTVAERVLLDWNDRSATVTQGYNIYRRIHRFASEDSLAINISDNDFSDWSEVKEATSFPLPPEDQTHIQRVWVANDREHLFIRIKHAIGLGAIFEPSVFIDVDRNRQTGSGSKDWLGMELGAELWYDHRTVVLENGGFHLTTKRRVWDDQWEGPYSADLFRRGNFADPFNAWTDDFELPFTSWSRGHDGDYQGKALQNNSWELKIPFKDLEALTGHKIDPRKFGVDLFFLAHFFDQFPTVGYGSKSPTKFEYGYQRVNDALVTESSFVDSPLGGLAYDYLVFAVDQAQEEHLVHSHTDHYVARAHPAAFNVSIADHRTLRVEFDFPEDPAISEVRVVRRTDRFATHAADGDEWFEVTSEGGGYVALLDRELVTGQPYFYSAFGVRPDGAASHEFWDAKDRSIPSFVKGPIVGLAPDDDYLVYFASWDEKRIEFAKKYDLVILHPGGGAPLITAEEVAELKAGLDGIPGTADDVVVIGYVSIGEDFGINRSQIELNTVLGVHPNMMDYPAGGPWENPAYNWPRKIPTNTTGPVHYDLGEDQIVASAASDPVYQFPSFYTDMIDHHGTGGSGQDGLPDQNREWGGLYVNVGDPSWQTFLREATIERDFVAGIDHVLGDGPGQLDCDGIFLDTVGISTPWSIWFPSSVYGELYWVRDGTLDFMARIGSWYADKVVLPNRPMHLVFPELAGKRYDDFRALSSAIYWESFTPDLLFWWVDEHASMFENQVIKAQSNYDGRGFTTMVLDYWAVMVDATEGGEFQQAPWYAHVRDQVTAAEENGFLTHVTGSRSLAEMEDYVYHAHHADQAVLADLFVHSIHGRELSDSQIEVTVKIVNQGLGITTPFQVANWVNDLELGVETVPGLGQHDIYEYRRVFSAQSIGNYFWVAIDPRNEIAELDEAPDFVEPNNIKGKLLDRYLHPDEHWRPDGIAPDVMVTQVDVKPDFPTPGEPVTLHIHYTNNGEGVAPNSRMFVWGGRGAEGRQIGNEPTPFLMPGETKVLPFQFTPDEPGVYSVGVNSDAVFAIIESGEQNNVTSARFLVLNQDPNAEPFAWGAPEVRGPFGEGRDQGIPPAADFLETSLVADADALHFRSRYASAIDFRRFQYVHFLDTDLDANTGYQLAGIGAEFLILDGAVSEYAGSGPDWRWQSTGHQAEIRVTDGGQYLEIHLSRSALGLDAEQGFSAFFLVTDGDNQTLDDSQGPIAFPPFGEDGFTLDGEFGDWDTQEERVELVRSEADPHFDGLGFDGYAPSNPIAAGADIVAVKAAMTTSHLWLQMDFRGPVDLQQSGYSVFLDVDADATTGHRTSWDSVGAEYRIWNGSLYRYTGNDETWETQWKFSGGVPFSAGLFETHRLELAVPWDEIGWEARAPIGLFVLASDSRELGNEHGLLVNGDPAWSDDVTDFFPEPGAGPGLFPGGWAPDLMVMELRSDPFGQALQINSDVTISGDISNQGDIASEPVDMDVWLSGLLLETVSVPAIPAGDSWSFEIQWQSPARSDSYWLGVLVDSAQTLGERDESNNAAGINVDVWD